MRTEGLAGTVIALGGVDITGFGQDEAITITPDGPVFTSVVGVDGTKERAYTGSKSFKIKLTLLPGSAANAMLTAIKAVDIGLCEAGAGGLPVPFIWKGQGVDFFVSDECWVTADPETTVSNEVNDRVWELETGPGKLFLGS